MDLGICLIFYLKVYNIFIIEIISLILVDFNFFYEIIRKYYLLNNGNNKND